MKQQIPNMEFGRRLAMEKDLEKSEFYDKANIGRSNSFICVIRYY